MRVATREIGGQGRDVLKKISRPRRMEPALTRRYKAIFENSRDAIYITTSDGTYIDANQATFNLFGYTREELKKLNAGQLYADPADARRFQKEIRNKGFVRDFEVRLRRKDGAEIDCLFTITAQRGDNGDTLEYQGIIRDITERKLMEQELRQSEECYRTFVDNINHGINLIDANHTIVMVNAAVSKQNNKPVSELIRKKCFREFEKRDAVCPYCPGVQTLGSGKPAEEETEGVRDDGSHYNVRLQTFPVFGDDGTVTGFIEISEDITERKRSEEKLRESEKRFRLLVEHSKDAFFLHDLDGKILDVNQHACESLGYTREELLGLSIQDIDEGVTADRHKERWQQMVLGEPINLESVQRRKDGKTFPVEVRLGVFESGASRLLLGLVRDITARKQTEEALLRVNKAVESSSDAIGISDALGHHFYHNKAFTELFEYTPEELEAVGGGPAAYSDKKVARKVFDTIMNGGSWSGEVEMVSKSGQKFPVLLHADAIKDESGKVIGLIGVHTDITDRKRTEELLQQDRETFSTILENALYGVVLMDKDGKHLYVNPAFTAITGYALEDIPTGKDWMQKAYPDKEYRQKVREFWQKDGEIEGTTREASVVCKDGKTKEIEFRRTQLPDGRSVVMLADITEQKRLEEIVEKERQDLKLIIDSSPIIIFYKDTEGKFIRVNKTFAKALKMPEDDLVGKTVFDLYSPQIAQRMADDDQDVLQSERPKLHIIYQYESAEGIRWGQTDKIPIYDKHGILRGLIGFAQDITERRQAEQALRRSYHKLQETLVTTVNALASTVEMRDPYTAGHQRRVTILACAIAEEMGLTEEQFDGLRLAGMVHDIGKNSVPMEILNKPGRISEIESNIIKIHPQSGYNLLKDIEFSWPVAQIVLQHHERLDGSGYPQGLKNGEIMLEAKILAVADVMEAMASHRPYRPALGIEAALEEITKNRKILYDPEVVDVCTRLFRKKGFTFK
jgi:PAS domain S-box-containing protein